MTALSAVPLSADAAPRRRPRATRKAPAAKTGTPPAEAFPRFPPDPDAPASESPPEDASPLSRLRRGWSASRFAEAGEEEAYRRTVDGLAARWSATPIQARWAVAVEQRAYIAEKALAADDFRVALAALDARDKLLGLADRDPDREDGAVRDFVQLAELAVMEPSGTS